MQNKNGIIKDISMLALIIFMFFIVYLYNEIHKKNAYINCIKELEKLELQVKETEVKTNLMMDVLSLNLKINKEK